MKAAVYYGPRDIRVQTAPDPEPRDDNIVIQVEAASICGTDIRIFTQGRASIQAPRILGHEVCGIVTHVPRSLDGDLTVGDRVTVAPAIGCGLCRECLSGATNLCSKLTTLGIDFDGGFAEYVEVPVRARANIIKVPHGLPPERACLAEPLACCINGQEQVGIGLGDAVAVIGMGPIGSMHVMLARAKGARLIVAIDISQDRLSRAQEFGATDVLCSKEEDPVSGVLRLTEGQGADVVIVACSVAEAQAQALQMCRTRGRVLLFAGLRAGTQVPLDTNLIHYRQILVTGSHASTARQNALALELIARGLVPIEKLLTRVEPLDRIVEAFKASLEGKDLKIAIRPRLG